jgi:hypothetical protein
VSERKGGGGDLGVVVRDDKGSHRYVIELDDTRVGFAVYHIRGGRHFFVHTEIEEGLEGRGWASKLIRKAVDDVKGQGGTIVPICPFVRAFVDRHPEYDDMVDWEILQRIESRS